MARYRIPKNSGKFTVCTAQGGHYAVWNRKTGKHEIVIPVRSRKQADEICNKLNRGEHDGTIEVLQ
jgi:hypothetical protein